MQLLLINLGGLTAYVVLGYTRAPYFGPETGGVIFNSPTASQASSNKLEIGRRPIPSVVEAVAQRRKNLPRVIKVRPTKGIAAVKQVAAVGDVQGRQSHGEAFAE
jgi:hypothetical protein